jgi:hypothetical protein
MDNPVWEWLIQTREGPYLVNAAFKGPSSIDVGPAWNFDRFGQSHTELPDGTVVHIAGEHEDYYDPDFYIYNDVVVESPDGEIAIYGYPEDVFPPTDFHTATLVEDRIYIIGNTAYQEQRKPGFTPVYSLSMEDWSISKQDCSGAFPGWLSQHKAKLADDGKSIIVFDGRIDKGDDQWSRNINEWKLDLETKSWAQLTDRQWAQWRLHRKDGRPSQLYLIRSFFTFQMVDTAMLEGELGDEVLAYMKDNKNEMIKEIGHEPDVDLFKTLYRPPVQHVVLEQDVDDEETLGREVISIDGVHVEYEENGFAVEVLVKGELPKETIRVLKDDLRKKLSALENTEYGVVDR